MDAGLKRELEAKVYAGERLTREDGVALYESDDLAWLGRLAHHKRTELSGERVMFNVSRRLSLTNVWSASCAYCSFQRKSGGNGAYALSVDEAVRKAKGMADERLTELHIVNGLHPTLPWSYYPNVLRELKAALPGVALKGFTATEIQWFEKAGGRPASEILDELMEAGLESLTGGGAEIFDWEVRQHIVDHDCHWADWSRIHRLAHEKGMKTPATMLYGHIEEPRHRVDHVLRLRELQDETGGFAVFSPLRYQHDFADTHDGKIRNRLRSRTTMAAPAESLKTFAVSRLMFDNVPHVNCSWVMHGPSVAQLSLNFGVDDLDGSVVEHESTHDAGAHTHDADAHTRGADANAHTRGADADADARPRNADADADAHTRSSDADADADARPRNADADADAGAHTRDADADAHTRGAGAGARNADVDARTRDADADAHTRGADADAHDADAHVHDADAHDADAHDADAHHADGYGATSTMHRDDLLHLIWDAGFQPVERTTRYEVVREYEPAPTLADRRSEPQQVWA